MSSTLLVAALAAAFCCGALGPQPEQPTQLFAYGVVALVLELSARRVRDLGVVSGGTAVYLAVGWSPQLGGRAALFMVGVGLAIRTCRGAAPRFERRLNESLSEALSVLGSVTVVHALAMTRPPHQPLLWAVGLSTYLALNELASRWLAATLGDDAKNWLTRRRASYPIITGPAFAAPALLGLNDWRMLFVLPFLNIPAWMATEESGPAPEQGLDLAKESLTNDLVKTQEALQTKVEERLLLEQLIRDFARTTSLDETLNLAVEMISRLIPCQSVVVFLRRGESVAPAAWRSPHAERLTDYELLAISEPIVEECYRSGRLLLSQPHHIHGKRLLLKEGFAVALPLADFGVLYVGRAHQQRYERKQLLLLALVADQTIPAILAGRRQSQVLAALEAQEEANRNLDQAHRELSIAHQGLKDSQAQLVHSSKLAAVGQLAAGVAHEINSPLAAVMIQLQSAQRSLRKGKVDKVSSKLTDAVEATRSAKAIIETLLEYSRPGVEGLEPRELDALVSNALSIVGLAEGVGLVKDLNAPGLVRVNGQEIQQIITNLLLNAQDAVVSSKAPQPKVEVRSRCAGDRLVVSVEDNGPGIPAEVAERIFEPFFTTKAVGQGTGLGLSVSLKLAENNGGTLLYQPGSRGARFELSLPRDQSLGGETTAT